jgi:hypothetical protein
MKKLVWLRITSCLFAAGLCARSSFVGNRFQDPLTAPRENVVAVCGAPLVGLLGLYSMAILALLRLVTSITQKFRMTELLLKQWRAAFIAPRQHRITIPNTPQAPAVR